MTKEKNKQQMILAIDIDGTLIPNSVAAANAEGIKKFREVVKDLGAILVYPTGRTFEMTCEAIGEFFLPRPDFLITDNGSVLYSRDGDGWVEDLKYRDMLIKNNSDFDREKIVKILDKLSYLQEQEADKQNKLKASFYTDLDKQSVETVGSVKKILESNNIKDVKLIYAQNLRNNVGLLEILPDNISKLTGIEYLIELAGASRKNIIFAGDEGNDLDVFASGIKSILVNNARDEIKNAVREMNLDSVYFAEGNEAKGVIEGISRLVY